MKHLCKRLFFVGTLASTSGSWCQVAIPTRPSEMPASQVAADSRSRVEKGTFSAFDLNLVAQEQMTDLLPTLEAQFASGKRDELNTATLASALVRLHDPSDRYWRVLYALASAAIRSGAPRVTSSNKPGSLSPEFTSWAIARGRDPLEAASQEETLYPVEILLLGSTGDHRATGLLEEGLRSEQNQIQLASARGLAEIGDSSVVSSLIDACSKAPKDVSEVLAQQLAYFHDPAADAALSKYVTPEVANTLRLQVAQGKRPFH